MEQPLILKNAYKGFTLDQDKVQSPEATVRQVKEKFRQLDLKILDDTVRIDNGRLDIPVYFSICGSDAAQLTGTAKQMGKGATPAQAEASAIMELVERFSFYSFADTPHHFITGTYGNLKDQAIPFELIARSVHDESGDLPISKKVFSDLPMRWTWGYNLSRDSRMLVPFDWFFAINEFNGTSAGNCVEEALCQGICEIVERHVSALVYRGKLNVPGILPESATDAMVADMLKKYHKNGIRLYVSDFTLDMGIPSVGVLAYDPSTFPEKSEIVWTAGTTPNPQKAFSRALSEVAQLAGDFNTSSNYVASGLPKLKNIQDARYITIPNKIVKINDLPDISDQNIKTEVENCIQALADRRMEVITVSTMNPQLSIPAFYSMIPGAHFRERAAATSIGMFACKLIAEKYPPKDAISELMRINNLLPDKYYIRFYLGTCYLGANDPQTAYKYFVQALELNPDPQDIPSIYSYMGVCLKDLGDYPAAVDVLKKGAALDPDRTDIHNLMGFCYFKLKKHEKAIKCFQHVIRLNPSSAIDYANIASNYREMGDRTKAIAYYQIALSIDPGIEFAKEGLKRLKQL